MKKVRCPYCSSSDIRKFGHAKSGAQRWQCKNCKATFTITIDSDAKRLNEFLSWLLSTKRQADMPGCGRTFRRRTSKFWNIWPMPELVDEIHPYVFVDGIWLSHKVVVLIACTTDYVLGWYMAPSENSRSWAALMARIAPPVVVLSDGGSGFIKAQKKLWPKTRVQRCTFHVFEGVKRYTTTKPRTQAGIDLYAIDKLLLKVKNSEEAAAWLVTYSEWCTKYAKFLQETTHTDDGKVFLTHERLVKAEHSLNNLIKKNVLFTYVDPSLVAEIGEIPATNNQIEGGINSQLRRMLRAHNGMSLIRRIKAIFWWCYMHTECPRKASEILKVMPTDESIDQEYRDVTYENREYIGPKRWGDAVVWQDLHSTDAFTKDWD